MNIIHDFLHSPVLFWMSWVLIPIVMEILPVLFNFLILLKRRLFKKKLPPLQYHPEITLIIPVYNSAASLYRCIESVYHSSYDSSLIDIMLVNNQSTDDSFHVFCQCQQDFPELTIHWLNSEQGKSKALNLALFNSRGTYILHIDSDGTLHPDAIYRIVQQFEFQSDIDCLTGTILTNPELIDTTKAFPKRMLQKLEFFEYCQAFLAGRNFQSEFNSIFTVSGAFSAFRKSAIMKTQLYNTDTICEDTHVTFQIRDMLKERIALCENAFFFADPMEDLNHLYIQRQRWQRGELEVLHMFRRQKLAFGRGVFSDFVIRLLMYDHTFAFPRMIWYFALIYLAFINYSGKLIAESVFILYLLYVIAALLLYCCIILFLSEETSLRRYYARKWYLVFLLPLFNFMIFWFRFAGIINAIKGTQSWNTKNLQDERHAFFSVVKQDFKRLQKLFRHHTQ